MSRLPVVGADDGTWGTVLNDYLASSAVAYSLSANTSVGATQIVLTASPAATLKAGALIAIDAGTGDCELRIATNVSGATITVAALERAHSADDYVLVLPGSVVHPNLFGCKGDNSTDDWQGLQRMLYQAGKHPGITTQYGPVIDGNGLTYRVQQPLTFSKHTMRNITFNAFTTFAPADANNAMMMSCAMQHHLVTVTASNNTFTATAPSVFPGLNEAVVFNNMYGETLPGNVVAGRIYYVKTRSDAQHITVSATAGGTELDVSADGSCWAAGQIGDLTKFWWRDVTINVAYADLSGLVFGSQQPADMYRLRVNMTQACSRTTYGVVLQEAQIARLYNPEFVVNGATNVVALGIGVPYMRGISDTQVTGVHVQDANFDGASDSGQTHIVIGGGLVCDNIVLSGETWLEGPGNAGIRLDRSVRGADLGNLYLAGNPTNGAVYETATAGNASWRVGQLFNSGSNHINVKTVDGVLFKSSGSSDNVSADVANVMHGMRRVTDGTMHAIQLEGRRYVSTASSITASWLDHTIDVDATSTGRTITLPSSVGVATFRFTIRKKDSSGNAVTVATTSSQTINGASTYSLASQYKYVTVESDGANWMVVANN